MLRRYGVSMCSLAWGLALCGAVGCDRGRSGRDASVGPDPQAVAQVDRAILRDEDLRRLIPPELRDGVTGSEIAEIVDAWIRTELLYQKAVRDGLDQDAALQQRIHDLQRQLLADELLQRELAQRIRVTNEEIQAYYAANRDIYTQEVQIHHIVLNTPEEAEEVLQLVRAGSDFNAMARQFSIDASGTRGGDLGFLGKGAMNPAFEPVVFKLNLHEVYGPLESAFGFHLVKVVARRNAAQPLTIEDARDEILQVLLLERQQAAYAALIAELRGAAYVHVADSYAGMSLRPETSRPALPDTVRSSR